MKKESEVAGEGESQCVEREQAGEAVIKGDRWQEQEECNVARGWGALEEAAEMWGQERKGEWVPRRDCWDQHETIHKNISYARAEEGG